MTVGCAYPFEHVLYLCLVVASMPTSGFLFVSEAEVKSLLRPHDSRAWDERYGAEMPQPGIRTTLVFLSSGDADASRAAAVAASLGYTRCTVVEGGLRGYVESAEETPHLSCLSRDAVCMLMEMSDSQQHAVALIDVRRHDERSLYGSIPGAVHVPVDQWLAAVEMGPEEWLRTFRFPKPSTGDIIILHSRTSRRAEWAAQIAMDAGLAAVYVYRQGVYGWKLDPSVHAYAAYEEGDIPPEPMPFEADSIDRVAAEAELVALNLRR